VVTMQTAAYIISRPFHTSKLLTLGRCCTLAPRGPSSGGLDAASAAMKSLFISWCYVFLFFTGGKLFYDGFNRQLIRLI